MQQRLSKPEGRLSVRFHFDPAGISAPGQARAKRQPSRQVRIRILELWHLLSLDAPSVATLWTYAIAGGATVRLPWRNLAAMFFAVWTLYAGDRLLDARSLVQQPMIAGELELRHLFHHRHRKFFLVSMALATGALASLFHTFAPATLQLDLILGLLLAIYFVLLHGTTTPRRLPKEIVVGFFFAAAVFIPTVSQRPELSLAPTALLFGGLCSLNCLCIHAWEHEDLRTATSQSPHARFSPRHLWLLGVGVIVGSFALYLASHSLNAMAIALAAAALLTLHYRHHQFASVTLRAAADLVLLTPLLVAFH